MECRTALSGKCCWLTYIIYILCHIGIVCVQGSKITERFPIRNNETEPGAALTKCTDGTFINILDMYSGDLTDIATSDVSRIRDVCSCKQTCTIPHLETTRASRWELYIQYECLRICSTDTDGISSTVSQTSPVITEYSTTFSDSFSTTVSIPSSSQVTTAPIQDSSTYTSATNTSNISGTFFNTGFAQSTTVTKTNKTTLEQNKLHNDNNLDSIIPVGVSAFLIVVGAACCITGFAVYRRKKRSLKCKDEAYTEFDQTERKGVGNVSFHVRSETTEADLTNNKQPELQAPETANEDDGYESIKFAERLHDVQEYDHLNDSEESASTNREEHLISANVPYDPYYVHPVHRDIIQALSMAGTKEADEHYIHVVHDNINPATVCDCAVRTDESDYLVPKLYDAFVAVAGPL